MAKRHKPNLELFHRVLNVQSHTGQVDQMIDFVTKTAESLGAYVEVDNGNVYATKGVAVRYPAMACHTDTVHPIRPDDEYRVGVDGDWYFGFNPKNNQYTGIGGDDKVGVFIALDMMRIQKTMKAVFFRDEERGCQGAEVAKMEWFTDCNFVLECDRRGNRDFVDRIGGEMFGPDFREAVTPILRRFGYDFSVGAPTDVGRLKENGLPIAAANMSCGYYNPHSAEELINWQDVSTTWALVREIIHVLGRTRWDHLRPKWERRVGFTHYPPRRHASTTVSSSTVQPAQPTGDAGGATSASQPVLIATSSPPVDETLDEVDWIFESWWEDTFPSLPMGFIRYVRHEIGYKRGAALLLDLQKEENEEKLNELLDIWKQTDLRYDEAVIPADARVCPVCLQDTDLWPISKTDVWWCGICEEEVTLVFVTDLDEDAEAMISMADAIP